ncbi:MAG TPA: DUF882 domain-containing protein [Xanthobacteraceae bacterium]|nr:DUF882 domain-containing protein [Xanthobacteraceae bacterium]
MAVGRGRQTALSFPDRRVGRRLTLAAVLLLLGAQGLQPADADGDTRTISLHHVHTHEDITVTFKRNGRYDEAALQKLNHFLRDWRKNEQVSIDPHLIDLLWEVHRQVGAKGPIHVICGYRSPETNAMLRARSNGVALFSQHMTGSAIDFSIPGVPIEEVRVAALRLQGGGVGYYPDSGSRFVHLDVGNVRHWPRMSREELVRVFPDQRTVHIPSDGRPLAGYALALADLERGVRPAVGLRLAAAKLPANDAPSTPSALLRQASLAPSVVKMPPLPPNRPVILEVGKVPSSPGSKTVAVNGHAVIDAIDFRPAQVDRVPPELALAYAAHNAPAPRAALQDIKRAAVIPPRNTKPAAAPAITPPEVTGTVAVSPNRNPHNPWMRTVLLAPSVYLMTATRFNRPQPAELAPLMVKPRSVMMMTFSSDPYDGMSFHAFSGKAAPFIATVTFGIRTASLR